MKTTVNNFIDVQVEKVLESMADNLEVEKSSPFTLSKQYMMEYDRLKAMLLSV